MKKEKKNRRYYPGINNNLVGCKGSCRYHRILHEATRGPVRYRELECVECGWVHREYTPIGTFTIEPSEFAEHVKRFHEDGQTKKT